MYIRKSVRVYKGKTYTNHLLVESVQTPKGPRQRAICSLGSLAPAPREQWLALAHKLQSTLQGQIPLETAQIDTLVQTRRRRQERRAKLSVHSSSLIEVDADRVDMEQAREAGPVHVGHQMWRQLGLDAILSQAGLSKRACILSEAMVLNRLIFPLSEHAMTDWIRRTAMGDIVGADFSALNENALYRNLDRLHPNREQIERELAEREKSLFNLDDTVYLYDLTSTYFEGLAEGNPQAKRGYSRDKRSDCKQVVVLCEAPHYVKLSSLGCGLFFIFSRFTTHNSGALPSALSHCRTSGLCQTAFLLMAGASAFSIILRFISMSISRYMCVVLMSTCPSQ